MTDRALTQIRQGLERLRALDAEHDLFGARHHRYELLGPAPEAALAELEEQHGFVLPPDYRAFLRTVGRGGAGPGTGLFELGTMDDGSRIRPWPAHVTPGEPFPHRGQWNDRSILDRGRPMEEDFDTVEAFREALTGWEDERAFENRQAYYAASGIGRGTVPLSHHGCGIRDWLVVTGPEAGHVFRDECADEAGVSPVPGRERTTFGRWYLDWLEASLAELEA